MSAYPFDLIQALLPSLNAIISEEVVLVKFGNFTLGDLQYISPVERTKYLNLIRQYMHDNPLAGVLG